MGVLYLRVYKFLALSLVLLGSALPSGAENLVVKIDDKGTYKEVAVPPNFSGNVVAHVTLKGNESQYVAFSLVGPGTLKVRARATPLKGSLTKILAQKSSSWTSMNFVNGGKEFAELKLNGVPDAPGSNPTSSSTTTTLTNSSNYCYGFSTADIDEAIAMVKKYTGQDYTREQMCALYAQNGGGNVGGSNGGGTSGGDDGSSGGSSFGSGATYGTVLLRKNTCGTKSSAQYVLKFEINLAGVSAEAKAAGYKLSVSATDVNFRGSKAGTLKPRSDGKFAPRALLLMSSTGSWGGEKVNVVRWSGAKASVQTLRVQDYVSYRGLLLTRVIAEPVLRGGKATVEVQSERGVYSACFSMSRSRQRVNGYTN